LLDWLAALDTTNLYSTGALRECNLFLGAAVWVMMITLPNRDLAAIIQAQKLQQS
jgi:hypothetical protein